MLIWASSRRSPFNCSGSLEFVERVECSACSFFSLDTASICAPGLNDAPNRRMNRTSLWISINYLVMALAKPPLVHFLEHYWGRRSMEYLDVDINSSEIWRRRKTQTFIVNNCRTILIVISRWSFHGINLF